MKKKKITTKPKSDLGINKEMPICYNCMWWRKNNGECIYYNECYDYNHVCFSRKIFRYNFERMDEGYRNLHI